ncbi:hypothetical protein [Bartonella birtlesii]|nr:hypothetical protein [Bartonella birtlesii]
MIALAMIALALWSVYKKCFDFLPLGVVNSYVNAVFDLQGNSFD